MTTPADPLKKIKDLLAGSESAMSDAEIAKMLAITKKQAREWLLALIEEGAIEKLSKPVRYRWVPADSRFL